MLKKRIVTALLLVALALSFTGTTVTAQSYSFTVPTAEVIVTIEADGTATLEYTYVFANDNGAHEIDFVDIGMPAGSDYDYNDMSAEIDGQPITHIQSSSYISNGVEFGLGSNAIPAGQSGSFYAVMRNVRGVVFPGTEDETEEYAGFQFQPNYFDGSAASGKTDMTVILILPPGLTEDEPRYYEPEGWPGANEPESGLVDETLVYYRWQSTDARPDREYVFGAAFPARLLPEEAVSVPPASGTFSDSGSSGSVGFSVGNFMEKAFMPIFCGIWIVIIVGTWVAGAKSHNKRRMQYLPPKISIEGHGIKRGLTAVEAAILLEQPMDKILTMILFSVVKKNAAEVITRDPLEVKIFDTVPAELRGYETDFLEAFKAKEAAARRRKLQDLMVKLVQSVTQKMKGFSHKETVAYYKQIIEKAWQAVTEENTPEVKAQYMEEAVDWTMADTDYEDRSRRVYTGPVYVPMWWGRYDPTFRPAVSSAGGGATAAGIPRPSGSSSSSMPSMPGADFAASVVNSVQSFSAGVIGSLGSFTETVTNKTNPIPKPARSGSSGRSFGGGCACACACASCACACAGGGR
jgi:hypothetical protein